jgi:periplasmic divalent cation tolerance protein
VKVADKVVVFITTSSKEEADKISEILLTKRKAACVNIVPRVDSRFWWQGKLDSAEESLLIVKTKESVLSEIVDLVKGAHSYSVTGIIALPIFGGSESYLNWVDDEVKG